MSVILSPISGEYDLIRKNPESAHTIRSVTKYEEAMLEMKEVVAPELQLIESRIMGPSKELQSVMKVIRKTITKREHKACFGQTPNFKCATNVCFPLADRLRSI